VAATTVKAALATTMQLATCLYEQVAERKGRTYYRCVDRGLVLSQRNELAVQGARLLSLGAVQAEITGMS
jgi:hypothetical protein